VKGIKLLSTTFVFSLIALIFVLTVRAMSIVPPDGVANPSALFGQDHAYTVTFRGNGEAVVNLRVVFTNTTEDSQTKLTFRVPRVKPQDLVAYQVIREPNCLRYEQNNILPSKTETRDVYGPPKCLEYDEPDYSNMYWYGKSSYKKAIVAYDADTITVTLPQKIKVNKSGSILLYYRSNDYTKKGAFDSYEYVFESLKTEDPIKNLQIGITTDSDLKLKNADAKVQYRFDGDFTKTQGMIAESKVGGDTARFDQYYQQIGHGQITKTATYLQPLDSFTLEGSYADSAWKLYGKRIAIGMVVVLILIAAVGYGIYWLVRYMKRKWKDRPTPSTSAKDTENKSHVPGTTFLWMIGGSFLASIFAAGYTMFIFLFGSFLDSWHYSEFNMLIVLFLGIVSFGIYPLLIFGPAIVLGIKRGIWWGVGTFVLTIMWLMIYLFILFGYMILSRPNNYYPRPVPYLESTQEHLK